MGQWVSGEEISKFKVQSCSHFGLLTACFFRVILCLSVAGFLRLVGVTYGQGLDLMDERLERLGFVAK